ncbi:hypothetical protein OS493_025591 [Desmophyllum pertusum]|uniref:Uncharacterized protein n=1 Tax=Desmophyllum pertusum TaxID=174260 RepID=A0A9W9ZZR5_9CNID|nr:hypothetical protein OS493_025591 [Desmophyllum pertusum]
MVQGSFNNRDTLMHSFAVQRQSCRNEPLWTDHKCVKSCKPSTDGWIEIRDHKATSSKYHRPHAYALKIDQLPLDLHAFLADSFFTRPHSLQRLGQCVSLTTYAKVERMLCFVKQLFPKTPLTSATFGQGLLIENHLDYLQRDMPTQGNFRSRQPTSFCFRCTATFLLPGGWRYAPWKL